MRKTLAAAAVLAAVLAPTAPAHAQQEVVVVVDGGKVVARLSDTGNGKALGNCENSSSRGVRDYHLMPGGVADGGKAKGNGGHQDDEVRRCVAEKVGSMKAPDDGRQSEAGAL